VTLQTGDGAPAFALPDRPGHDVRVAPSDRPAVLLFFPLAFSSVCTREMCTVRDGWAAWRDADVYAISVDSPFVTARWREEHGLPFPVLSDFNREVAGRFGVLYEDFYGLRGVAKRAAFVLDPGGRIVYDWVTDDADVEPDYAAIVAAVRAAECGGDTLGSS
jgi:peroxiredoxin